MATLADVHAAVKARIAANFTAIAVRYANENNQLPDTPAPFVFVEIDLDPSFNAAYGGGRGQNRHRTTGELLAHFMWPVGWGVEDAFAKAEEFAALFRNYRDSTMSCFAGGPMPGTGKTEDGSYSHCATVAVDLFFDLIG